jgi:acetoin utilization deacetylase AcuC-like enzyme
MVAMPIVWDERCRLHEPGAEVFVGLATPGTEVPARADALLEALGDTVPAQPHDDEILLEVHDRELVAYLESAWESWRAAGVPEEAGQNRVVPYVFAHERIGARRAPRAEWARPGYFAYDTMTLIGPGTWEAARGAVDAALTAVDLVANGSRHAYALCRPPGHHVCRAAYGGSCYLNNAAVAAQALRRHHDRVAVLDVDAHHGNGTQEIFWDRDDVRIASVHVDPAEGWFPHFLGFADESTSSNLNLPLPPGTGDDGWLSAVRKATEWLEAEALVVSLGVDAGESDPESPLRVTAAGFRAAGTIVGVLELPTVLVQEGGYDLETLGSLTQEFLIGVESAA